MWSLLFNYFWDKWLWSLHMHASGLWVYQDNRALANWLWWFICLLGVIRSCNLDRLLYSKIILNKFSSWFLNSSPCSWLQLRSAIDPKRHYKKGDSKSKTLPKYFQASLFVTSRLIVWYVICWSWKWECVFSFGHHTFCCLGLADSYSIRLLTIRLGRW